MGIRVKIKGINRLEKKLNNIATKLPKTIETSIEEILKNTCEYAIRLRRGNKNDGILFEMVETDNGKVKGRIYTDQENFPYSWFEHFGTGQYAEQPHVGTSKHFIESGYEEWFIPVNKVNRDLPYKIITIQGNQFYIAHGVQSNPFLQKAEFELRDTNIDTIQANIYNLLQEVCK
jgi:hypothetical protein